MRTTEHSLTNSVDESNIDSIYGGDLIYSIPYFQRSYRWTKTQLTELTNDIVQIIEDEEEDVHFLGAIILFARPVRAGASIVYEVVDGQQRLTTVTLILCGLIELFAEMGEVEEAANLFTRYLILPRAKRQPSNLKLHPSKDDRSQYRHIIESLLKLPKLKHELSSLNPTYLSSTGSSKGNLNTQFRHVKNFLSAQAEKGGYDRLYKIYEVTVQRLTIVQIQLKDPTSCSRIFERLNFRGVKVSTGDLVRNEIFSRIADRDTAEIEALFHSRWQPFYEKFTDSKQFEDYFFPYGLILKSSISKPEVFSELRASWSKAKNPEEIIDSLSYYQSEFLDIVNNTNNLGIDKDISIGFSKLHDANMPGAINPFLMQFLKAISEGRVDKQEAKEILLLLDSFLTRRAICGIEPTGLHAVFKRLWRDCVPSDADKPTAAIVEAQIKRHKTVPWPNNLEVTEAIRTRHIYGTGHCLYIIREYEVEVGGDTPKDKPHLEHILPQKLNSFWEKEFKDNHEDVVNLLANLVPISPPMNSSVGGKSYEDKRARYEEDSMYKTPRTLAKNYTSWDNEAIRSRSEVMAAWVLKRWPK